MPRRARPIVLAIVLALVAPWVAPCLLGATGHGRMPCCPQPGTSESPAVSACCGAGTERSASAFPQTPRALHAAAIIQGPLFFHAPLMRRARRSHPAPMLAVDIRLLSSVFLI